ncbi:MAG TPA: hypothetical protein VGH20_06025 [Myxococcales bacterium]|jgi:hypothetical protein
MKRLALALVLLSACGGSGTAPAKNLHWFATCGAPLCTADAGVGNGCADHQVGESCTVEGDLCGNRDGCHGPLVCAASDPLAGVVCPL